ncbi:MAG TPA: hypothetical protein PKO09_01445 [Anaerolineae bacterium]|nr:hypothetical protein [Anaerolineae bacterium]
MHTEIRPLGRYEEFKASERLQRRVWAMSGDLDVIPLHLLLSAQRNGALVLGAFDGDALIGLLFGYLGRTPGGSVKHCSHLMCIAPEVQGRGIGFRLKLAQREFALAQGCDLVTWTFDPLESRNANLNIHKLGAVCHTYYRDYYGPMEDGLNRGLPSDRFQVEWWIGSERVRARVSGHPGACLTPEDAASLDELLRRPLLAPGPTIDSMSSPRAWVEIPANFQEIRASDPAQAVRWRLATRRAFQDAFAAGSAVTDLVCREGRAFYLLTKESE